MSIHTRSVPPALQCPDENTLLDLMKGDLPDSGNREIDEHVDGCATCTELLCEIARTSVLQPTPVALVARPDAGLARGIRGGLPHGDELGRYVILHPLGRGGVSTVYSAYDTALNRKVALKLVHTADDSVLRDRLVREARIAGALSHPNVVTIYDVGEVGGEVFISMEHVDGSTLRDWCQECPRTWLEVVNKFVLAGRGLAAAHRAGAVHRDFKPSNVLIGDDGRVRLADFGLAGEHRETDSRARDQPIVIFDDVHRTRTGTLLGTPAYMAPEQHACRPATPQSDQFSFCAALFEALFGSLPFRGRTIPELRDNVLAGRRAARTPGVIPCALFAVIDRGLAIDPADRHPSMDDLLERLTALVRFPWRRRPKTALAAVFLVCGVAIQLAVHARTVVHAGTHDAPMACQGGERRLAGVWDGTRRREIADAVGKSHQSFAAETWRRVEPALDGYATEWLAMHRDACEATHVRGTQSADLLDRRVLCLEERRGELAALTEQLASRTDEVIGRAAAAASTIPPIADCANVRALLEQRRPGQPIDAIVIGGGADAGREAVGRARELLRLGDYRGAIERAAAAAKLATESGDRLVEARALQVKGAAELAQYDSHAEPTLHAALLAAHASGDSGTAGAVARDLSTLALNGSNFVEAQRWVDAALAEVEFLGRPAREVILTEEQQGLVAFARNDYSIALDHFMRARNLKVRTFGSDSVLTFNQGSRIGATPRMLNREQQEEQDVLSSLHGLERLLGPKVLSTVFALRRNVSPSIER